MLKELLGLKKTGLIVALIFLGSLNVIAQNHITGQIRNSINKNAIVDANIFLMQTKKGGISDKNGRFFLSGIESGKYNLKISILGYESQIVKITLHDKDSLHLTIDMVRENKSLDEVKVIGELAEQRLLSKPNTEPISLDAVQSTISRVELIEKGAISLIDGMRNIPGGLVETRGRKVKHFFSVRGQNYPYPSYTIDGIWQKEFQETAYFYNAANIDKIQIVRSGSAILKSLSPLAGVIDVSSRRYDKKETNLMLKYGSNNSYQSSITHGNRTENLHYFGGVQIFGTDGPKRRNGEERIVNVDANLEWKINEKLEAGFKMFYLGGSRQLVQPIEPAASKFMNRKESYDPLRTFMLSSRLKYKANEKITSELQVNFAHRDPKYNSENLAKGTATSYHETDYELTINQLNAIKLSSTNVLRIGGLFNHWEAPKGKRYFYGKKAEIQTFSGVIADQQRIGKCLFDIGFRFTQEYYKEWGGFSIEGSGGKFSSVAPIKNEWQSPVWQATAGFTYSFTPSTSLHTNIAAGIVTPRKGALNMDGVNPENENRINIDMGLIQKLKGNGQIQLTGFLVNRQDAISLSGDVLELNNGEFVELYTNNDKRNFGVELDVKIPLLSSVISASFNATIMKAETQSNSAWKHDDEVPEFIANTAIHLKKNSFDCNLFVNYTGEFKNDRFVSKTYLQEFGKAPLGDFYSVDLTCGYTVGKKNNLRFFGEIRNAFDITFQTVAGYPNLGRNISIGVNLILK